jgi:hypothetical protein
VALSCAALWRPVVLISLSLHDWDGFPGIAFEALWRNPSSGSQYLAGRWSFLTCRACRSAFLASDTELRHDLPAVNVTHRLLHRTSHLREHSVRVGSDQADRLEDFVDLRQVDAAPQPEPERAEE